MHSLCNSVINSIQCTRFYNSTTYRSSLGQVAILYRRRKLYWGKLFMTNRFNIFTGTFDTLRSKLRIIIRLGFLCIYFFGSSGIPQPTGIICTVLTFAVGMMNNNVQNDVIHVDNVSTARVDL